MRRPSRTPHSTTPRESDLVSLSVNLSDAEKVTTNTPTSYACGSFCGSKTTFMLAMRSSRKLFFILCSLGLGPTAVVDKTTSNESSSSPLEAHCRSYGLGTLILYMTRKDPLLVDPRSSIDTPLSFSSFRQTSCDNHLNISDTSPRSNLHVYKFTCLNTKCFTIYNTLPSSYLPCGQHDVG